MYSCTGSSIYTSIKYIQKYNSFDLKITTMSFRKIYLILIIVLSCTLSFETLKAQVACEYSVEIFDTYGYGSYGTVLIVTVDGMPFNFEGPLGGQVSYSVPVTAGSTIEVTYLGSFFNYGMVYFLLDSEGEILFQDGPTPAIGQVFSGTATCPSCPTPANVVVDDNGAITADISWNPPGTEGMYFIEYDTLGFTPGTGQLDSTFNNHITLTGLQEDTEYEFYVQLACSMGDSSNVSGPHFFETIWLVDVGISNILSPQTECGLDLETVTVEIKNYGDNPQALIPFYYSVNGVPANVPFPTDGLYTGVLSRDSTDTIDFDTESLFSEQGEYVIQAWTEYEGDSNPANDTFTFVIFNLDYNQYPYFTDFEASNGGWTVMEESQFSTWEWGEPQGNDITSAADGVNAWVTNLFGNYNNSERSYIISPCFDFSAYDADPTISFALFYDTETSYDGGWVETSIDGGETWTKLGSTTSGGVNWYNFTNFNTNLGDVWAGSNSGWFNAEHPLTGFAGEAECRIRFAFGSDGSVNNYDGIGVDNITVTPPLTSDLATLSASSTGGECGDLEDYIALTIRNNGSDPQTEFDVSYSINGNPPVTENVGSLEILQGEEATYTFNTPFNSAGGSDNFDIEVWIDLDTDQNLGNNSTSFQVNTIVPDPLPWVNDFEDFALPNGWTTAGFLIGNGHDAPSYVIYSNIYSFNDMVEFTTYPVGPINEGDSMTFDYRYVDFSDNQNGTVLGPGDIFNVYISIDCGESFFLQNTIDETNHAPSTDMANITIDLDAFAGEEIVVKFEGLWGTGDYYLDIDNINIQSCPFSFNSAIDILAESSSGAGDASIAVAPTYGSSPYSYEWGNGETTSSIENLTVGVYTVTITDANACNEVVDIAVIECPASLGLVTEFIGTSQGNTNDGSASVIPEGGTGPYTFAWSNGGAGYQIENIPVGAYSVTVTDSNGCQDIADINVMVSNQEIEVFSYLGLYPNPATDYTTLEMTLHKPVDLSYRIVNSIGQIIYRNNLGVVQTIKEPINLNDFSQGNYFIVIQADDKNYIKQLVVQH